MTKEFSDRFIKFYDEFFSTDIAPTNSENSVNIIKEYLNNFISDLDLNDVSFDGEGYYFGRQITLLPDSRYYPHRKLGIEIVYDNVQISIYTHNTDTIVPEFIKVEWKDELWDEFNEILIKLLRAVFYPYY